MRKMMRPLLLAAALMTLSPAALAQAPARDPTGVHAEALLAGPPAPGSAAAAADWVAMGQAPSPERVARATADRAWGPWVALSPVLGDNFTAASFPRTARVFGMVNAALGPATGDAKDHWKVRRPFWSNETFLQCGASEAALRGDASPLVYSYPSGHATGGWAWALVAAELLPNRADALLERGREYGESRVICGFHYPSDVEAGRTLGAAVVARLHADADFRRALDAARRELARAYSAPR